LIGDAMKDTDVDVRSAAAIAATQTQDRNLTTPLRNLLDDNEPQVQFAAAIALWKMGDRSGEDILMSVVEGDKSTSPGLVHGTEHKISRDLHDPAKLAKLGAMQGAAMLLGPFGVGISAIQFIHQSGGNAARVTAIEQLADEHTPPVHKDLIDALQDKDAPVRTAAAKALADYDDPETQKAVYGLMADPKSQVRLMAAAAYLRTTGTPGPEAAPHATARPARRQRTLRTK
jgi:HEAT repeat protein